jgi:hypothetical protein
MTITKILTPVVFAAAVALVPATAHAQRRGGGGGGGRSSGGSHAVSRGGGSRGAVSSRGGSARSGPVYRGSVGVRGGVRGGGAIRGGVAIRGGGVRVAPRIIGSRGVFVGGRSFYRPYYSFRPRFSLGFGLWAGYPVPYPYYYDYDYGYPYGYAYPYPADPYSYGYAAPSYGYPQPNAYPSYPPPNAPDYGSSSGYPAEQQQQQAPSVGVQPGSSQSAPGGVSFEITPDTAAVFVDGTYVGTAGTFGPSSQPLGLIPGRHHIEVRASGYRTMTFDADVTAGQVIPYKGALERN